MGLYGNVQVWSIGVPLDFALEQRGNSADEVSINQVVGV